MLVKGELGPHVDASFLEKRIVFPLPEKALEAMIHQTEARHPGISSVGRDGFGYYDRLNIRQSQQKHSGMKLSPPLEY